MSACNIQEKVSNNKTKLEVIDLVVLEIVSVMYRSGTMVVEQIPQTFTSRIFLIDFTVFSWAVVVKLAMKLRN